MTSPIREAARNLQEKVDVEFLGTVIATASLTTADIRTQLREERLTFVDPDGSAPLEEDLAATARELISRATRSATVRGAITGSLGALGIPPELVTTLVADLHLAQRLVVLHGHDPETDRGQVFVLRAMAAGWGLELPEQSALDIRVQDMSDAIKGQLPTTQIAVNWLARTMAKRTFKRILRRIARLVPGLGMGVGALDARSGARNRGGRMHACLARSWVAPVDVDDGIEDAVEIAPKRQ